MREKEITAEKDLIIIKENLKALEIKTIENRLQEPGAFRVIKVVWMMDW